MTLRFPARAAFLIVLILGALFAVQPHAQAQMTPAPPSSPPPATSPLSPAPPSSGTNDTTGALVNPLKNIKTLPDLVYAIIDAITAVAGIALTVALIVSGFRFVAAQGNATKLKEARVALMWTLIGGGILLAANAIAHLVQTTVQNL